MIKSLIGINKNLDKTGSRNASSAGCLGNNHLGLLGLLGHTQDNQAMHLLWFFFSFATSSLFLLTPLVIIGEDSVLWTIVILLSPVQLPFSFLVYSLISLIFHWTYYSSTDSLILVNSHCSSHYGLFSPFLSYSFMFYFLPFLSIFSWSVCTSFMYLNLVVTICILHSWSTQYKRISSLIS